jgi:carboxylesterase
VLLIHSLGGTPIELRFVAHALSRAGYVVHCPLLPGLAGGTDVSGLSSWEDWYAAVEHAHDEIAKECDVILVGGLSAGAMLALKLAAQRPDLVQGLMLFAPTIWPNGWAIPWYFHLFRLVHYKWFARMFHFRQRSPFGIKDDRIRNFIIDTVKSENRSIEDMFGRGGGMVLEFRRLVRNVSKVLGHITQQTLIFHPRLDDQSNLGNAIFLQKRLGGPVEMHVLDDCYHMVTLDRQRALVVDRSVDFASRITRRLEDADALEDRLLKGAAGRE